MSSLTVEERKKLIAERRAKFDEDNKKESLRLKEEAHALLMSKWNPSLIDAHKTGELNVSWQGFTEIIPQVFEFKNLIALRLVVRNT